MKTNKNAIITFVKNPVAGKVKTRIAKTAGNEKALEIYKALMSYTRKIALSIEAERFLFYSDKVNFSDDWPNEFFTKVQQPNGNLGNRLTKAFETAFQYNDKVVVIGSDCASLTTEIVQKAFNQLDQHDFVIGPAIDGGYYLLGMNKLRPQVFENINWSTETVFEETKTIIDFLGCTFYELPTLSDIDFEEDWEKYGWKL